MQTRSVQTQTQSTALITSNIFCLFCTQRHTLDQCSQLKRKSYPEKLDFLKEKGVCFGCLHTGHMRKDCGKRISCKVCYQKHPTVLLEERKEDDGSKEKSVSGTAVSTCGHTGAGGSNGILSILPVNVKCTKGNKVIQTYAFLDPGSTDTFCSESLKEKLNLKGKRRNIHIRTMTNNTLVPSYIAEGLEISELIDNHYYPLLSTSQCIYTKGNACNIR